MLIKIGRRRFNLVTFGVFAGIAGMLALITLQFEFFSLDPELLAELFANTRVERETAFVELAMRLGPWLVVGTVTLIGGYLALE